MPLKPISLSDCSKLGVGLQRPEDVVVSRDGHIWASDEASACAEILPDGSLRRVGRIDHGSANGINLDGDGRIVIANFEGGPLQRLDPTSGTVETLLTEVDGRPLTASNYPILDRSGNIWCSNSTDARPWQMGLDGRKDGFIYRVRPDGRAAIVADGILFANGLAIDADESHLYVCQTTGCNVLRFPIQDGATLGAAEPYGPRLGEPLDPTKSDPDFSRSGLTDGCGFDVEGNLWVTLVMANRVVAITPHGEVVTMLDDPSGQLLLQPTNVTWGGPDLRDLYIGSVASSHVVRTRSPLPGLPLFHQH